MSASDQVLELTKGLRRVFSTIMDEVADDLARGTHSDFGGIPAALMAHAVDTFGDPAKAHSWLTTPNAVLGNARPIELVHTPDGARQVEEVLTRIDYGIFS